MSTIFPREEKAEQIFDEILKNPHACDRLKNTFFAAIPSAEESEGAGTDIPGTVFAADPLGTINSLSDFIFSAIKAIGLILLGFGIVQIGLSLKSHDASQRANGFLTFFGGVIIAFAKDILDMIM